jgi:hypothetical protein
MQSIASLAIGSQVDRNRLPWRNTKKSPCIFEKVTLKIDFEIAAKSEIQDIATDREPFTRFLSN